MHGTLSLLIALAGVSIPVIVLAGRHIVQPLADVLARRQVTQSLPEPQIEELHDRIDRLERTLAQVVEEQQFQRALQEGSPQAPQAIGSTALPG
ncbi:MAG: hypothetical protein JO040_05325 [Gemmatimonadetes bacterium]|nr:hypothetical protein [Gemmatimonadota bacterium]